jgi:DNA modification methylase
MEIKPYGKNAKKHPKKQIEQVANSIKEFGMNQPIVVDKNGVIIVGHGRFEALKHLGMEVTADMVKVVDLTEEQAMAYRLADNKLNESEWDMGLVIEELKGLSDEMLDLTGFEKDLIIEPDEKDDEVPETPEEPQSKLGDLYELGGHRVLCGDSTDLEAILALTGGAKADMVFTDPPFGLEFSGRSGEFEVIKGDHKQSTEEFESLIDGFVVPMVSVIKKEAACFIKIDWRKFPIVFNVVSKYAKVWNTIIWGKDRMGMGKKYRFSYEILVACSLEEPNLYIDRKQPDLYIGEAMNTFGRNRDWKEENDQVHPTQTPVNVIVKFISDASKKDDIVLDCFLGSGSTVIASEKTGRKCYGMELDPKYVDVIVQRYVDYTGNENIKLNGEYITWKKKTKSV